MKTICVYTFLLVLLTVSQTSQSQCNQLSPISLISEKRVVQLSPELISNLNYYFSNSAMTKRVIFLVPGLNGNYNTWRDVRDETGGDVDEYGPFPARYAEVRMMGNKHDPGYSQDAGLASAAKDVWDYMSNINYASLNLGPLNQNIAIGHSQGGLVLRAVEYSHAHLGRKAHFGGLVTFGTPHQGAAILTNGLPISQGGRGQLGAFINDFCVSLTDGPIQEELQLNDNFFYAMLRLLNLDEKALDIRDHLCKIMADSILPYYILKDYTSNITGDYMAHDESYNTPNFLINTLNNHQPGMPMIAFYGVEDEPVFWRQLGSITKKVHSFPAFQADPDQDFVESYADLLASYRAKELIYQRRADTYQSYGATVCHPAYIINPFTLPVSAILCTIYQSKRRRNQLVSDAYERGWSFLKNSNDRWKGIIGARKTRIVQKGYLCDCDNITAGSTAVHHVQNAWECPVGISYSAQGKMLCQVYPNMQIVIDEFENDGVVLASSAKQLPGALVSSGLSDQDYRMDHTNHQQMRNSSETAKKLNRLFDLPDYGFFFMTPRL